MSAISSASSQIPARIILHSHLEGSLPERTLRNMARRNGVRLWIDPSPSTLSQHVRTAGWTGFLDAYKMIATCFCGPRDFLEAVCDYASQLSMSGVLYAEIYCTPWLHLGRGVSLDQIAGGLRDGVLWARNHLTLDLRILIDLMRADGEPTEQIIDWFLRLPSDIFVGLGITGGPGSTPLTAYEGVCRIVKSAGRGVVVHAGEMEDVESIRQAVWTLNATRIGHGVRLVNDLSLATRVRDAGVHLEVCPSSNMHLLEFINVPDVLNCFCDLGLSFSINPDDELIFDTCSAKEIGWTLAHTRLTVEDLLMSEREALTHCFADTVAKSTLQKALLEASNCMVAHPRAMSLWDNKPT